MPGDVTARDEAGEREPVPSTGPVGYEPAGATRMPPTSSGCGRSRADAQVTDRAVTDRRAQTLPLRSTWRTVRTSSFMSDHSDQVDTYR